MSFAKQNPKIPEGINTSSDNPLKEFTILLGGILLVICAIAALLLIFSHQLAPHIPFRYEQALVNKLSELTSDNNSTEQTMIDAELALQELGQQLAENSALAPDIELHFHLLDEPDVPNAFATLGGHIFVTTGLLREVPSENALAMVLAHEIAHIKFRHPAQSISGGLLVQLFLSAVTGQNAVVLQSTVQQAGIMTVLGFSRKMETAADRAALDTLEQHYGHLADAEVFFEKVLAKHQQASWQAIFASHPDMQKRIEQIKKRTQNTKAAATKALDPRLSYENL